MENIVDTILIGGSFYLLFKFFTTYKIFSEPKLYVKFNHKDAIMPFRATKESAGVDLFSCDDGNIEPHSKKMIDIGLSVKIPEGYYGRIAPRSGLAMRHSIDVGAGVIDSDYRGNINVILFNHGDEKFKYNKGDKLAQLIIEKIALVEPFGIDSLDNTERGINGFGSTGISNNNIGINYNYEEITDSEEENNDKEETIDKEEETSDIEKKETIDTEEEETIDTEEEETIDTEKEETIDIEEEEESSKEESCDNEEEKGYEKVN